MYERCQPRIYIRPTYLFGDTLNSDVLNATP